MAKRIFGLVSDPVWGCGGPVISDTSSKQCKLRIIRFDRVSNSSRLLKPSKLFLYGLNPCSSTSLSSFFTRGSSAEGVPSPRQSDVTSARSFAAALWKMQLASDFHFQEPLPGALVPDVRPGSAGARSGLFGSDIVLSSPSDSDLVNVIKSNPEKSINVKVKRSGLSDLLEITPDLSQDGTGWIGVQLSPNFRVTRLKATNLADATSFATEKFVLLTASVLEGLQQTFFNFSQSAEKVSTSTWQEEVEGLREMSNRASPNEVARGGRRIPRDVEQSITSLGVLLVVMLGLFLIVRDTKPRFHHRDVMMFL